MFSLKDLMKRVFYACSSEKQIISYIYKKVLGRKMNWENPKDINEKINWLKLYADTTKWSEYADKYAVRSHLEELGLGELLVKLYGKYDTVEAIDFDQLPNSFVIKVNHGSGDCMVVTDKSKLDIVTVQKKLTNLLKYKYGRYQGELHYTKIKPCIIVEELLIDRINTFSTSLVDYKIWCFNGKPYNVSVYYNRTKDYVYIEVYDLDWRYRSDVSLCTKHFRIGEGIVPRPKNWMQMLNAAAILSQGFPELRVDFYEVNNKLYFGEMTFSSSGGYMNNFTHEYLLELGNQCVLPTKKK